MEEYKKKKLKEVKQERTAYWLCMVCLITQLPFWLYLDVPSAYVANSMVIIHVAIILVFNYRNEKIYR